MNYEVYQCQQTIHFSSW